MPPDGPDTPGYTQLDRRSFEILRCLLRVTLMHLQGLEIVLDTSRKGRDALLFQGRLLLLSVRDLRFQL